MFWTLDKSYMRSYYDTLLSSPEIHQYTKVGNMKLPSRLQLVQMAWDAVSIIAGVKNSFLSCAITTSTVGSDNKMNSEF